jgi:hypothetical protein
MRNRSYCSRSSRNRFLPCWVTHAESGLAVTPLPHHPRCLRSDHQRPQRHLRHQATYRPIDLHHHRHRWRGPTGGNLRPRRDLRPGGRRSHSGAAGGRRHPGRSRGTTGPSEGWVATWCAAAGGRTSSEGTSPITVPGSDELFGGDGPDGLVAADGWGKRHRGWRPRDRSMLGGLRRPHLHVPLTAW